MGRSKAVLPIAGAPMAGRVADAMRGAGATEVVLVGGDADEGTALGLDLVADRWPGEGPLAGLATATMWAADQGAGIVFVAACDQPNLSAGLFTALATALTDAVGSVVVTPDGREQPFPAAWRPSVAPEIERLVAGGKRRADAASALGVATVHAAFETVIDVDRPDDVAAAERAVAADRRPAVSDHGRAQGDGGPRPET